MMKWTVATHCCHMPKTTWKIRNKERATITSLHIYQTLFVLCFCCTIDLPRREANFLVCHPTREILNILKKTRT